MTRDLKLDSLKGFLIVLVVIGHIPFSNFNIEKISIVEYFGQWFYIFHMPLFFAVSVLFIKTDYQWLFKRASFILIPYLFWFFYGHKRMLLENPIEFIEGVLMGNWSTLNSIIWFLPALFTLNLLFFLFKKSNKKIQVLFLIISLASFIYASEIAMLHYQIPFGFDVAIYLFLLVLTIKYIYENKERFIKINMYQILGLLIISSLLLFNFEPIKTHSQWYSIIDLAQFSVATTVIGYISFFILNISIFIFFIKIKSNQILEFIGNYSFPIFLLHLIILYKLPNLIKFDSNYTNFLFLLISTVLSILLPIVISKILMKISDKFEYIGMVK